MNENTREAVHNIVKIESAAGEDEIAGLEAECQMFTRHLVGYPPNAYVIRKYREAHFSESGRHLHPTDRFERYLVRFASRSVYGARLVDVYTGLLDKRAVVRSKNILLLAILESCAPFAASFEILERPGFLRAVWQLAGHAILFVLFLIPALLWLLPVRVYCRIQNRLRPGKQTS